MIFDVDDLTQSQILDETDHIRTYIFDINDLVQRQFLNVTYFPLGVRRVFEINLFISIQNSVILRIET